jgi:hypothetical protein
MDHSTSCVTIFKEEDHQLFLSEWDLLAMGLPTVAAGTVVVLRRRRAADA